MTAEHIPENIATPLVDPRAYAGEQIHDTYKWLRANNPLGRAELEGYDPFWVVTKHADILEISRQNALFHNGDPVQLWDRDKFILPALKIEKDFVGKKPRTRVAMTKAGRKAFARHVAYLKEVIETANVAESPEP